MEVAVLNTYFKEHTVTYKISGSFTQVDNMLDILNVSVVAACLPGTLSFSTTMSGVYHWVLCITDVSIPPTWLE